MKKYIPLTIGILVVVFLIAFMVVQGNAQQANSESERATAPDAPTSSSNYIPIQGMLTDASGNPLNGTYEITFRLYDVVVGGTALCQRTRSVNVNNGLFNQYFEGCSEALDGRQLYLGMQVEDDGEMTPRQYIDNVPYAWSLRPGADIVGTIDGEDDAIVYALNNGTGAGMRAVSVGGNGLYSGSILGNGISANSLVGAAVYANAFDGVSIAAAGTGVITSTAESSLWISGSGVRPYRHNDTTIIDMDTIGGAKIYSGAEMTNKNVMLPITIPGMLYGQNVKVTGMEIHWVASAGLEGISAVLLRRQTGVCEDCYDTILHDTTDYVCAQSENPTGCVETFNLTTNNVLSDDYGVIYLTIEINFASSTDWIEIGGVKLTLEHDN